MSLFFAVEWMWVCVICLSYIQYWVVWLHSEGSFVDLSKLSVVISVYWAREVSGTWLLIAVICSIPAASSSHWPTISFLLSIHKSYFMTVRSFSTNYTCSCLDEEGKDRKYVVGWRRGCFCDTLSNCIWFQVLWELFIIAGMFCQEISETILSCSQTQAEKRCEERYCLIYPEDSCSGGFMEFSDQWSAHCFLCSSAKQSHAALGNAGLCIFQLVRTGPRSIKVRPVTWTMTLYMQWMCFLVLQSLRVILPEVRLGICQYLCKGHSMCYALEVQPMRPWLGMG